MKKIEQSALLRELFYLVEVIVVVFIFGGQYFGKPWGGDLRAVLSAVTSSKAPFHEGRGEAAKDPAP
ncbi:hypothetical protein B7993_14935 [Fibrobacter sp. UWH3]|nr:hypothetical protein B7993_14935 [Fibrobacter sp. UWH3]